jgi:hypothetical protein
VNLKVDGLFLCVFFSFFFLFLPVGDKKRKAGKQKAVSLSSYWVRLDAGSADAHIIFKLK